MIYKQIWRYGLTERFVQQASLFPDYYLGRVSGQHGELYHIVTETSQLVAKVSGKFMHEAQDIIDYPAVGDWVMLDRMDDRQGQGVIHHILRRKSLFTRLTAGTKQSTQIIAANIDLIFICMSLNHDFNLRRLERYLSAAYESMAMPVVVLTKADLCDEPEKYADEIRTLYPVLDVFVTSAEDDEGIRSVQSMIHEDTTIAFVGSSGVGKSTLINHLAGSEVMSTAEIRQDDRGRHTTTHREMLLLPQGGVVIDTPGMREFRLGVADVSSTFEDIEILSAKCRFRDCTHKSEPGCAVKIAIEEGSLDEKRLESYWKLQREIQYAGMDSRQMNEQKIKNMFGSKSNLKQMKKQVKNKKHYN